jgi:hypothetical protein
MENTELINKKKFISELLKGVFNYISKTTIREYF